MEGYSIYKIREIGELGIFEPKTPDKQRGIAIFPNGDIYVGQYKNNKRHGRGMYKSKNGEIYVGEWYANKRHGKGIIIYPDKGVYKGKKKEYL